MQAISHNGQWFVRIDDIDPPRIKPGAVEEILAQLDACGFFRRENGCVYFPNRHNQLSNATTVVTLQSDSDDRYHSALQQLTDQGAVFACQCSRRILSGRSTYPGTCRDLGLSAEQQAIRLKVADTQTSFDDVVFNRFEQNVAREIGDFIVRRRDGLWSYQLASVVDDWHDGVSEIVRGADLLDNTPRQIVLLEHLGLPIPNYTHVPIAADSKGKKLSKQTLAEPVDKGQPLPALLAVWRFLGQPVPANCETVAQFWEHAELSWDVAGITARQIMEVR